VRLRLRAGRGSGAAGIVLVLCFGVIALPMAAAAQGPAADPCAVSDRPPDAREVESESSEVEGAEPAPCPSPATASPAPARPAARPSPAPTPLPTPVPLATPAPEPAPAIVPTPEPAATTPPSVETAPATESAPAEQGKEQDATILDKIGTFQDIEDIDLSALLSVTTAGSDGETRTLDDAPVIVTVVTEEDIRRIGARNLEDVLETLAGFEVLTDSLGRQRIFVRGVPGSFASGASENVLVLLNGHRLNESISGGATAVNLDLPVDNIKKLEVVRGPGSVSYGPGSFLAVLNIVTESVDTFRRDELTLGAGSFSTFLYSFRYGTTIKDVSLAGFLQFARTGGPDLSVPEDVQTLIDRSLAPFRFTPASLAGRADHQALTDRKTVDANISAAYKDVTFSGRLKEDNAGGFIGLLDALGQQNRLSNKQVTADLDYRRSLGFGDLAVRAGYTQSDLAEFLDVLPPNFTVLYSVSPARFTRFPGGVAFQRNLNSRRYSGQATVDRQFGRKHTASFGVLAEREATYGLVAKTNFDAIARTALPSFDSVPALVPDAQRRTLSAFVQDTWNPIARLGLMAGVRVENYDDFGTKVNPRGGVVWRMPHDLNLKLTYGRAVRLPSFSELYYSSPAYIANRGLRPSVFDSGEAALLWRHRNLRLSASVYRGVLKDVIEPRRLVEPAIPEPLVNANGVLSRGADLEANRQFGSQYSVQVRYSYQDPQDRLTHERLADVPTHLGTVLAQIGAGRYLSIAPSVTWRSSRPRVASDLRAPVPAYALVDLTVRIRHLLPSLEVTASGRNLLDKQYFDPAPFGGLPGDYPRAGRALFIKARYKF
jgi:outer membrane receptor protein involved in Fe transport